MSQPFRTMGGAIDRTRALSFTFDGRRYTGHRGDTLASALLANGVHLLGRSFKYHRPRGILAAGEEEPNALVEIDRGSGRRDANLPATTVELFDGLVARSQNRWPSLAFDAGAVNSLITPLIPAGFYYKSFLWPRRGWAKLYEPLIRRAAGLGRAPDAPDPDRYAQRFDHCEVLVVGGGRAGLGAALEASADPEARVMLCEQDFVWGGKRAGAPEIADLVEALDARPNVTLLPRTTASIATAQGMVSLIERVADHRGDAPPSALRQRLRHVRAGRVVLATGAHERPITFPGNDRPGVMLAGAARAFLNRWGVLAGRRVVLLVAHDSGYAAAADLALAGAHVTCCDLRPALSAAAEAVPAGVELLAGVTPLSTRGRLRVSAVQVAAGATTKRLPCDALLMAGGWTPAVHLWSQMRGTLRWSDAAGAYVPDRTDAAVTVVGSAAGPAEGPPAHIADAAGDGSMAFVDYQNDVTAKDIALAVREGFRSVEHIKRYTTTGMATDQGRTSNINAMAAAGKAMAIAPAKVGITSFRAPYTPAAFGALAGHDRGALFDPERCTVIDGWAEANGATFEPVSLWRRARYFARAGEDMHSAVARECRTVRAAAGIFDASTLGKIEVVGPDAAEFMNRLYVNPWTKLEPGRCRYGVMLREDGFVYDDGVVGRLAPDRFHVTTTTGGAAGVLNLMEDYRQTEFPDLRVWLTSTTEQWAVIAVQGPRARDIIAPLVEGIDLSPAAFPHMAVREGRVCGVSTRLFRVSFTGELGFEVNVPASHGLAVWEAIMAEGAKHGACPYGTEAMHVLRAEKGFIIIGQETDGTVTPDDVGLGWAVGKAKRDFVGKRSLSRPDMLAPGRKQLVGLRPQSGRLPDEGAQLTASPTPTPFTGEGHVTSAYMSDAAGGPICLALLANGRARTGETVHATSLDGSPIPCRVVAPVFVDPEGARLNG